jgi:hypothetical protein
MNTFTETVVQPEGGPHKLLRYMVFATDDLPAAESLGGFQYDHDDLAYIMQQLREEALTTKYRRYEVLDTRTFITHVLDVQTAAPPPTYRVVLQRVPDVSRKDVLEFLSLLPTLVVRPRDIPLYVQTCPSFISQQIDKTTADRMVDALTAMGATAVAEVEG